MAKRKKKKIKKQAKHEEVQDVKQSKSIALQSKFQWDISKIDLDYPTETRNHLDHGFIFKELIPKLKHFETMNWGDIKKNETNNHFVTISESSQSDSLKRLKELELIDVNEEVFSLRLDGQKRLYGYICANVFIIIWYDKCHRVYPSKKKNT